MMHNNEQEETSATEEQDQSITTGIRPMTDDELVTACMSEISRGIGGTVSSDNDADISIPLDYYFGRVPGLTGSKAKDPNASRYISMDVMDGVEATIAEIMPAFTTDMIAFYEPEDERDEDAARMESELVNYLFFEEYDGYLLLQTALRSALLHRNCTAKVFWDERAYVEYDFYEGVVEMGIPMILKPTEERQDVEITEQEEIEPADEDAVEAKELIEYMAEQDPLAAKTAAGKNMQEVQQIMMAAQAKYNIKVKRTTVIGKPRIESVPPEQVIVAGDHTKPTLFDVRFVAHENSETQSSLIEQGFDPAVVTALSDYAQNIEDLSRSRNPEEHDYDSAHPSTRTIRVYECYPLIDFDGDGIAERRKVVISDGTLLSNEEWKDVPMIGGVVIAVPYKYKGVSMFDRLRNIQESKTPVVRAIIDGTILSSNPRIGVVKGGANLDDMLTSRTGGVVRMENPNALVEIPNPQVPSSSYTMLDYMDKQRNERGGAAINTAAQAQKVSGDTAHGIERVLSVMELNNAVLARTVGETLIRGIFVQLHEIIREHAKGMLSAKVGGRWINTTPAQWKRRTSVSIQIGSSNAERGRQAGVMREVIGLQKDLISQGSSLTNEEMGYKAITDGINLSGVRNPERYFLDPESPEGQQARKAASEAKQKQEQERKQLEQMQIQAAQMLGKAEMMKGQAALESQKAKLDIATNKQESDNAVSMLKMQLEQAKTEADNYKAGASQAFDYTKLAQDVALALTKMEVDAARDLSKQKDDNKP